MQLNLDRKKLFIFLKFSLNNGCNFKALVTIKKHRLTFPVDNISADKLREGDHPFSQFRKDSSPTKKHFPERSFSPNCHLSCSEISWPTEKLNSNCQFLLKRICFESAYIMTFRWGEGTGFNFSWGN